MDSVLLSISSSLGQAALTVSVLSFAIIPFIIYLRQQGANMPEGMREGTHRFTFASLCSVLLWCISSSLYLWSRGHCSEWIQSALALVVSLQIVLTLAYIFILWAMTVRSLKSIS